MKISLCSISFREQPLEEVISKTAKLGYEGIEIFGEHIRDYLTGGGELASLRELAAGDGLSIAVISPYFNFTGSDEEYRRSFELAKNFIGYAVQLRCPVIRTFVSNVGSVRATPLQWERCISVLKELCGMAVQKDIIFALETHPGQLMDSTEMTLRLLREVDASNLRVLLDIWNLFNEGGDEPLEALERLFPYVVHIHAKNMVRSKEGAKVVYLSEGDMDYGLFFRRLREKDYQGYISIEWFGDKPWEAAEHEMNYLKTKIITI